MTNRSTSAKVARSDDLRRLVDTLGDWTLGPGPLFRQLSRALSSAIESGSLPEGLRLPSERALSSALFVSRGTVLSAYDLLLADGLLDRRPGSGSFVAGPSTLGLPDGREGTALVHRLVASSRSPSALIDLSISVLPDPSGLPPFTLSAADLSTMVPPTGYSPWGSPGLRALVADHITDWGLPTVPGQVVITAGAQQAISAAASCWLRPGDTVVLEDPTYPGAVAAFSQAGARLHGLPLDGPGVSLPDLAHALSARPSLLYLQPTVQSPTGTVLPLSSRRRVAELVSEFRVPLVEDLSLADLAWHPPPPPIASFCPDAPVAVVGSISKVLWGGLRLGFVRAPEPLALRFARVKATSDLGTSAVSQILAERLLGTGDEHGGPGGAGDDHGGAHDGASSVWTLRAAPLRSSYDLLASLLASSLPDWRFEEPAGGLSLWVSLSGVDAEGFSRTALRHGVAVATAGPLSVTGLHRDRIRLSFASPHSELRRGVDRLASAWASHQT